MNARHLVALINVVGMASCGGGGSPTQPEPPTPAQYIVTGIIGSAAGGGIAGATARINDGPNANRSAVADGSGRYRLDGLLFADLSMTASASGFVGSSRSVTLHAAGDRTATANFTLLPEARWTHAGIGNTVFDMPTYLARVRIIGTVTARCENFIVRIGGRGVVNEILGTCSIAVGTRYDAIHLTNGGGVVEIVNSSGVTWSFEEQR